MNAKQPFVANQAQVDEAAIAPLPNSRKVYIEGSRPLTCNGNIVAAREHILVNGDEIDLAGVQMCFEQRFDA